MPKHKNNVNCLVQCYNKYKFLPSIIQLPTWIVNDIGHILVVTKT